MVDELRYERRTARQRRRELKYRALDKRKEETQHRLEEAKKREEEQWKRIETAKGEGSKKIPLPKSTILRQEALASRSRIANANKETKIKIQALWDYTENTRRHVAKIREGLPRKERKKVYNSVRKLYRMKQYLAKLIGKY